MQIGVNLYKTLVRPHMEYAVPVWANISDKDVGKLEETMSVFKKNTWSKSTLIYSCSRGYQWGFSGTDKETRALAVGSI